MTTRILIVDDSTPVRSFLKKLLESHSTLWEVCGEAGNGAEAVQKALDTSPDLIIIDLTMPIMDGLTASAQLAKRMPGIPIVIFTLHKSPEVDLQAKKVGVRAVISKSDAGALLSAVGNLLGENADAVASIDGPPG